MGALRTYGGIPVDQRREQRRRRLVDGGLQEFGTRGYDATSVKDVCRRARLTERYFYEHFADRHALLEAVYDEVAAGVMTASFAAAESAPPELAARARAGLAAFVGVLTDDPRRARVQLIETVGRGPELQRRRSEVMDLFAQYLADAAADLHPRPDVPAARRRALAAGLVGATNHLVVEWMFGARLAISQDELVETLVSLALGVATAPALGG